MLKLGLLEIYRKFVQAANYMLLDTHSILIHVKLGQDYRVVLLQSPTLTHHSARVDTDYLI